MVLSRTSLLLKPIAFSLLLLITIIIIENRINSNFDANEKRTEASVDYSPVLIVPGTASSTLEARLTHKPTVPHFYCKRDTANQWFTLWLSISDLLPGKIDCWADNIRLLRNLVVQDTDNVTVRFRNNTGVDVKVNPTGLAGIERFAFKEMIDYLLQNTHGYYQRDITLTAIPYDFRMGPSNHLTLAHEIIQTVEELYGNSNQTKVTLISHSMGCAWILHVLQKKVSNEWKAKYLKQWIALAPAWGGTVEAVLQLVSGDALSIPLVNGRTVRQEQSSYESTVWLLPDEMLYGTNNGSNNKPFLINDKSGKSYSTNNYLEFFNDLCIDLHKDYKETIDECVKLYGATVQQLKNQGYDITQPPNVNVTVFYGHGIQTAEQYVYKKSSDWSHDDPSTIVWGDGDGTVNWKSLVAGLGWREKQILPVTYVNVGEVKHTDVLKVPLVLSSVLEMLGR